MGFINLVMEVAETTKQVLQGDSDCADEEVKAVDARCRDIQGKYMASGVEYNDT